MVTDTPIDIKQAVNISITTVVDNYTDVLLTGTENVKRATLVKDGKRKKPLLAEHGLSFLIEIVNGSERHVIMMDFGLSSIAAPNNIAVLELDLSEVETFVISHGHHDHIGAIKEILSSIPRPVDVVVHPDAFIETRLNKFPDGREVPIPSLRRDVVNPLGCPIVETSSPMSLANGYAVTITGIPRVTDFEKGLPTAHYKLKGKLFKDDIMDDQGLVFHVKDKGLVIITGCSHAGIINTILHAQNITGVDEVYAVIGGFHLTGPFFETIIDRTIEEMKRFSPKVIVPTHCTGWKAMVAFEKEFSDSFVLNSVGTTIIL